MNLLIHTCCADCLLKLLEGVKEQKIESVAVFFYNPNIHPRTEYLARLEALKIVLSDQKDMQVVIPDWSPKEYFSVQKNYSYKNDDSMKRCVNCWTLRLETSFIYAKQHGFDTLTTTLLTSHYQNIETIRSIASKFSQKYEIQILEPSIQCCDIKTGGFYKQNYCGCVYSLIERLEEKFKSA